MNNVTKQCYDCKETKAVGEFHLNKRNKDGYMGRCKKCRLLSNNPKTPEQIAKRREANRLNYHKHKRTARNTAYARKYGITLAQYEEMLTKQDNRCAICRKPETRIYKGKPSRLAIDHDHRTGKARELLCKACNTGLGCFNDNLSEMERAMEYLKRH